eukprot:scaffold1721_cov242-Pinguiococcus_pyrenoidosus.AAC.5
MFSLPSHKTATPESRAQLAEESDPAADVAKDDDTDADADAAADADDSVAEARKEDESDIDSILREGSGKPLETSTIGKDSDSVSIWTVTDTSGKDERSAKDSQEMAARLAAFDEKQEKFAEEILSRKRADTVEASAARDIGRELRQRSCVVKYMTRVFLCLFAFLVILPEPFGDFLIEEGKALLAAAHCFRRREDGKIGRREGRKIGSREDKKTKSRQATHASLP